MKSRVVGVVGVVEGIRVAAVTRVTRVRRVAAIAAVASLLAGLSPRLASAQSAPAPITTGDAIAPPPAAAPAVAPPPPAAPAAAPAPRPAPRFTREHRGLTFETALGIAQLRTKAPGGDSEAGFGPGLALGVGMWLSDRTAVGLRFGLGRYRSDEYGFVYEDATTRQVYLGVALQHWLRDQLWIGGGIGGGQSYVDSEQELGFPLDYKGVGLELRAGVHLAGNACHSLSLQLDVTALNIDASDAGDGGREDFLATSLALLLGYQYL